MINWLVHMFTFEAVTLPLVTLKHYTIFTTLCQQVIYYFADFRDLISHYHLSTSGGISQLLCEIFTLLWQLMI